ncbi:MAG: acyl-CoA dehydrogenase family protein [Actinomycetota bacterium]
MNFDFDDTQLALRDLARDLFAKESPPSRIRGLWDGKPFDRSVWKTMADAGITGITVPEAFGGADGNDVDLALVFEEAGRAALPEPLVETAGFAAPVIAEAGSDAMKQRWLPAIASGEAIAAVEGPLDGHVAWAHEADLLIVLRDATLHVLDRERFRATPAPTIDPARPLSTVDVDISEDTALDVSAMPRAAWRALVATAGVQNGIAMRLLELSTQYAKDREQFGRPIGSFQAIKHKLADMHTAIEATRATTWYAAYAIASGTEDETAAAIAKIAANSTEAMCNRDALQIHGGIGFTWEHDLHFWLKRGMALRSAFGTTAVHRRTVARSLIGT